MCVICNDPTQCPQVCPDCHGKKKITLATTIVDCDTCKGEGCLCPLPQPGGVSHTGTIEVKANDFDIYGMGVHRMLDVKFKKRQPRTTFYW